MLRTVLFFMFMGVCQIFCILLFVPYFIIWLTGSKKMTMKYMEFISKYWSRFMIWGTGSKVAVSGLENIPEGNALFVSNHQGSFDIILILGYIPRHIGFIAKIELNRLPLLNIWMRILRCVFMDRKSMKRSAVAISKGVEHLKEGYSLVIFPEGTRSRGGPMNSFKPGSFKLAFRSGVPVVPVTISGSYKVFEETGKIKPANVKMTVHPYIETVNLSEEEQENLIGKIEKQIASAL